MNKQDYISPPPLPPGDPFGSLQSPDFPKRNKNPIGSGYIFKDQSLNGNR